MKIIYRILCIAALLVLHVSSIWALKPDPKLVTGKLSNGLTYYIYPNDYPKGEAVFRLFIKSGSVFEEPSQRGLAHFLEHMAFNGTVHFPDDRLIRFLESRGAKFGADLNAHTSYNETVYKLQLPTKDADFMDSTMTILSDWAGGFLLDSLQIDKERGVIYSEWLSKKGPQQEAQDAFLMELLNGSRFSERKTIGDTAVILHAPHDRLREYYQHWYHPKLMAVAVAGDVDVKQMEKLIHEKFDNLNKPDIKGLPNYLIPEYSDVKAKVVSHESLTEIDFSQIQLLPMSEPIHTEAAYKSYLNRQMLNRLMMSRLNRLSFENQPYNEASVSISSFLNTSNVLLASAQLIPNKLDTGIQVLTGHLEQMYRFGFIPLEINKVKKSYMNALERNAKTPKPVPSSSYMDELYGLFYRGDQLVSPKEELRLAKKYMRNIDSLSIVTLLHETVKPEKMHYMLTGFSKDSTGLPSEKKILSLVEEAQKKAVKPYTMELDVPETLLPKEPKAGKVTAVRALDDIQAQELTLSNGAKVIFRRSVASKSQLTLTAFRKGGLYAMDSTSFVSGLYASGIIGQSGAGAFSREALNHFLAGNTASVRFLIDRSRAGIAGNSNLSDKETLFKLMYLRWTQPRLDTVIFKQIKDKAIEAYRTANHTDEERFARDFSYMLQGCNFTNKEQTDTVLQADLKQSLLLPIFDQAFGSVDGYTFIVTADCHMEELKPLIIKYIGGLPGGKAQTEYTYAGPVIPHKAQVLERRASDSPKASVTLSFQEDKIEGSLQLFDLKADMVKAVLRMKLLAKLREEMGMVYSVSVSVGSTLHPNMLSRKSISFVTMPENAHLLIDSTYQQIRRMVNQPTSFERELADVKTNLIKDIHLQDQQDSFWGSYIRNSLFNKESDWKWVSNFEQTVNSITTQDLAAEMKRCFLDVPAIKAIMYPK
jgi:zinc protease